MSKWRLSNGQLSEPAKNNEITTLSNLLGYALPADYVAFLRCHNGGEGFIGENYFIFWKAEELVTFNREYEVEQYAPGIFLFGSSGGGEGYGFDTQWSEVPIVRVPFIGMDRRHAKLVAQTFSELFSYSAEL